MTGRFKYLLYFIFAISALAVGVSAISRLLIKADLPFTYGSSRHESVIENDFGDFKKGSIINAVRGIDVESAFEIEVIIDNNQPGDNIPVTFTNLSYEKKTLAVTLVRYYKDYNFILITAIAGFTFWILGVFIIISKPNDRSASLLFLTLVTFSVAILSTAGYFGRGTDWIGYAVRISHTLSYIFGSVFFLMFMINFPYESIRKLNLLKYPLYILISLTAFFAAYVNYITLRDLNTPMHEVFQNVWSICEITLLASLIAGTLLLINKYIKITDTAGRRKIEWIFWGMSIGVGPFILFWLIPNIFELKYILNEELILAFLIIVPVTFTIAVVRYQLLDIEILIKRSIIYFVLISLLLFLYFELIFFSSNFFTKVLGYESKDFYIIAAILIALLMNPLRLRIKRFVDRVFYREKYAFDKAVQKISALTKECRTYDELGSILLKEINELIPVKSIALVSRTLNGDRMRVLAQNNFDMLKKNIRAFRTKNLNINADLPFALEQKIETGFQYSKKLDPILKRWQIALIIPLSADKNEAIGALLLGDKLSGAKYSGSDYELLNNIASSAALIIRRIELQEKLILEEVELEKAKEISELKSYFVASVSHDLKTPLSAIKIFSELLQNENITKEKSREYLSIIDGETERLKRMIENVLDFSKMEKGLKQFNFRKIDLNESADEVLKRMNYELSMKKFTVDKCLSSEPLFINGDPEAINSVLENLISNSIKYSEKNKHIAISTKQISGDAEVIIEDSGKGISEKNLSHIFDPFFREDDVESSNIKGAGFGLSIVKNIVNAHHADIEVKSSEGAGSTFKITFKIYQNGNKNSAD